MIKGTKGAFTLAEVLITLGIIGVVAAMTMPTLLNSTQGAQYRTAFKKAISVLSQAVVLNIALDDYDLSEVTSTETDGTSPSLYNLFHNRMNVVNISTGGGDDSWTAVNAASDIEFAGSGNYTLFFNDGIVLTFLKNAEGDDLNSESATDTIGDAGVEGSTRTTYCTAYHPCFGVIDVNGSKNPNKVVVCDEYGATQWKEGNTTDDGTDSCTVASPTDIFPVKMYDQTILPSTRAGRAVMYKGK